MSKVFSRCRQFGWLLALVSTVGFLEVVMVAAVQEKPTGDPNFVPSASRLELLFDGGLVLTEEPAVGCDHRVYFSDITFSAFSFQQKGVIEAGHIWVHDPQTAETTIFRSPSGMSNGLKFDAECNLIAAEGADFGGRRITKTDMNTGKAIILAGLYEGKPFNAPNDLAIDEKGRIYFSDPRYLGHEPVMLASMAVYRIDPDGSLHRIVTDAGKPNGVAISSDQKTLYLASHNNGALDLQRLGEGESTHKGRMALLAYDLLADGTAKFRSVLVDYYPEDGADGLVVDIEGNLWVAVRDASRPGIYAYNPDGVEKAYIPTPLPTNVGFGRGEEANILYITAGRGLYRIKVGKRGYQLPRREVEASRP